MTPLAYRSTVCSCDIENPPLKAWTPTTMCPKHAAEIIRLPFLPDHDRYGRRLPQPNDPDRDEK